MIQRSPSNSHALPLIFPASIHLPWRWKQQMIRSALPETGGACFQQVSQMNSPTRRSRHLEAEMSVYRAYIVGLHDRSIGVIQMDCIDDESAIKSATQLVDDHDVELWQMDRPVARFDARSKQICKK
jgi:hypothetical protein